MYYSLQYLSLSDAVVLTFLIPTVTAITGYFCLGESFSRKEAMAGCELIGRRAVAVFAYSGLNIRCDQSSALLV